jgi:hypothetical protein
MAKGYTPGEVLALIAPLFDIHPDDIDQLVIITKGKCEHCGKRDGYKALSTSNDPDVLSDLLSGGAESLRRGPRKE